MTNTNEEWQIPAEEPEVTQAADQYRHLPLEEQVTALLGDLEGAQREARQNLDLAQRAQADLANFRRRTDEERISSAKYSNGRLITKLLPVKEDLDLALTHADEGGPSASWLEGVKLIQRKLLNLLESEDVALIEAEGAIFNPLEHEALGTEETTIHPPGHIIKVVRAGYRLHDRVIQPAQVIVARGQQIPSSPEEKETEHE